MGVCRPPSDSDPAWCSPWERKSPIVMPAAPIKQREKLRWLGCRLLYGNLAGVVPCFTFVWAGIILVTAGADNSTMFGLVRVSFVLVISTGFILLLCLHFLASGNI